MKATPVPEVSPLLPNTMLCRLTAVPKSSGMPCVRRVDLGAVVIPALEDGDGTPYASASMASSGNCSPAPSARIFLKRTVRSRRSSAVRSVSSLAPPLPSFCQRVLEGLRLDPHDHVTEHADEAAVGVVGEPRVVGELGHALDGLVVQAQVEDGVHHAGHGEHRTGSH